MCVMPARCSLLVENKDLPEGLFLVSSFTQLFYIKQIYQMHAHHVTSVRCNMIGLCMI